MRSISIFICILYPTIFPNILKAQEGSPITEGTIQFERKVDVYLFLDQLSEMKGMENVRDKYEKENPQFQKTTFLLTFNAEKTLYQPLSAPKTGENEILDFLGQMAAANSVYSDLTNNRSITKKNVQGDQFLIADSIRRIHWRLRAETREIAGFHCRRADAMIMDSLYIIAFFSEQIKSTGGPESFSGLPGMILGVALPRRNITWFATSVKIQTLAPDKIELPVKGKPLNTKEFNSTLQKNIRDNIIKKIILERSNL